MKKTLIVASAGLLLAAVTAQAHHSFSMFDPSREEVIEGTVVQWAYNSPHTLLFVEDGEGTQWVFEGAAPPAILGRTPSMTGATFAPGQHVFVVHCPLRDGRTGGGVGVVITDDGMVYNASDAGCNAEERSAEWAEWVQAGYKTLAEAQAATGGGEDAAGDGAAAPAADDAAADDAPTDEAAAPAEGEAPADDAAGAETEAEPEGQSN